MVSVAGVRVGVAGVGVVGCEFRMRDEHVCVGRLWSWIRFV